MSVKLALLKSGETIVSDVKELIADNVISDNENKICGYLFENPQVVDLRKTILLVEDNDDCSSKKGDLEIVLFPWIVLTSDKQILVMPDWVVTIVEPIEEIKKMYEEKVNAKNS
jgi:hypothetical protein